MEDDDAIEPDQSGHLELKYRGWTELPENLACLAHCLISIDVSFNQLQSLPDEISSLCYLQVLDCSCNKLQFLPDGIGSLESLMVLKANGNQLASIPSSIGGCKQLQQLILSENILLSLPHELEGCNNLQKLLVQNNDISRLPLSLATLRGTIIEIDLSNNNQQLETTIPIEVHRDIDSIMWILALQFEKRRVIDGLKVDIKQAQHAIVGYEFDLSKVQERITILEQKKEKIKNDLEKVKYFLMARTYKRNTQVWMERKWEEIKRACATKL